MSKGKKVADLKVADLPEHLRELVLEDLQQKAEMAGKADRVLLRYHGNENFFLPDSADGKKRGFVAGSSLEVDDWNKIQHLPSIRNRVNAGVLVAEAL